MKRANVVRLIMDLLMVLAFIGLMDLEHLDIGMHERVGLGLGLLFLGHLLVNRKLVVMIAKKITQSGLAGKTRLSYIVDVLLLIAGVLLMVSGLGISETLPLGLSFASSAIWIIVHHAAANWALGLMIIHLLLHWHWLKGMGKMMAKVWQTRQGKLGVITATVLVTILVAGVLFVDETVAFKGEEGTPDGQRGLPSQATGLLPRFTMPQLATYNGQNGQPAYISVEGKVYDVSDYFINGEHHGALAGQDQTGQVTGRKCTNALFNHCQVVGALVGEAEATTTAFGVSRGSHDAKGDDDERQDHDDKRGRG